MKKFSDFGIQMDDSHIFQVPQVSITEILNCEIDVIDFEAGVKTQHGEGRYVVKVRNCGEECKFFTNSTRIKDSLDRIPKDDFPFTTTIRSKKLGSGSSKMYYFT